MLTKAYFYLTKEHQDGRTSLVKGLGGPIGFSNIDSAKSYADAWSKQVGGYVCHVRQARNTRALGVSLYRA